MMGECNGKLKDGSLIAIICIYFMVVYGYMYAVYYGTGNEIITTPTMLKVGADIAVNLITVYY